MHLRTSKSQTLDKAVSASQVGLPTEPSSTAVTKETACRPEEATGGTAPPARPTVGEPDEMDVDALGEPDDEAEIVEFSPPAVPSLPPTTSPITPPKADATLQRTGAASQDNANAVATDTVTTPISPPSPSKTSAALSPHANKLPIPRLPAVQYGTAALPRSRSRPQASRPAFSTAPATGYPLTGSPNVALTYDSFWSSHSTSSNTYRSPLLLNTTSLSKASSSVTLSPMPTYSFPLGSPASLPHTGSTVHSAASELHSGAEPG